MWVRAKITIGPADSPRRADPFATRACKSSSYSRPNVRAVPTPCECQPRLRANASRNYAGRCGNSPASRSPMPTLLPSHISAIHFRERDADEKGAASPRTNVRGEFPQADPHSTATTVELQVIDHPGGIALLGCRCVVHRPAGGDLFEQFHG